MPNAINIPFVELVDPISKTLLTKDRLESLFKIKGVDFEKPIITSCGSGVTASIIYFALDYLGLKNIAVYDGSWTEYASIPTSTIIKQES
jgi:thiosulfate/3-mercaptopyruvate sulfurtransferase